MEPSLALVPPSEHTVKVSVAETAGSHGLHDAMRHGQRSLAAEAAPKHPLESRLSLWNETQDKLQLTMQRNIYGVHAPVRSLMERQLVAKTPLAPSFAGLPRPSNIHLDILTGRDSTIEPSDVFIQDEDMAGPSQETTIFHVAMEKKLNL